MMMTLSEDPKPTTRPRKLSTGLWAQCACLLLLLVQNNPAVAGGRRLVPSDGLQIHVVNQGDLDTQTRIGADGTVVFPYAGRLKAAGLTEDQLAEKIKSALAKAAIVKDPQVIVSTTSFGTQISVAGAVRAPSVFSVDRPTTVTEALTRAGGLAEGAKTIVIKHRTREGWVPITIDAKDLFTGRRTVEVQNGDEIYVKEPAVFYLYGYVGRPGRYPLTDTVSVQQALSAGGGVTEMGSDWRIEVKRRREDGELIQRSISLDEFVKPNDTIIVNERLF